MVVPVRPRKHQMTNPARSAAHVSASLQEPLRAACPTTCPRLPDEERIGLRHRFVEANGIRFHLVEAGSGPLVLLLHGFLDFWYGWRDQIPILAAHFRVIAPDLRGYNLTDKPASGYDPDTLAGDVTALIQALGEERAHLVGHSWGGIVAWDTAIVHPEVVDRLAVVNAPHPAAYQREWDRNPIQRLRSWYMALFQLPWLPEWLLTRQRARGLIGMLQRTTPKPSIFTPADLAAYRRAMLRPGPGEGGPGVLPHRLEALVRRDQSASGPCRGTDHAHLGDAGRGAGVGAGRRSRTVGAGAPRRATRRGRPLGPPGATRAGE